MSDVDRDCPICGEPQQEHTVLCEGCDEYRHEEGPK